MYETTRRKYPQSFKAAPSPCNWLLERDIYLASLFFAVSLDHGPRQMAKLPIASVAVWLFWLTSALAAVTPILPNAEAQEFVRKEYPSHQHHHFKQRLRRSIDEEQNDADVAAILEKRMFGKGKDKGKGSYENLPQEQLPGMRPNNDGENGIGKDKHNAEVLAQMLMCKNHPRTECLC